MNTGPKHLKIINTYSIDIYGVFMNRAWKHIISHETLGFS